MRALRAKARSSAGSHIPNHCLACFECGVVGKAFTCATTSNRVPPVKLVLFMARLNSILARFLDVKLLSASLSSIFATSLFIVSALLAVLSSYCVRRRKFPSWVVISENYITECCANSNRAGNLGSPILLILILRRFGSVWILLYDLLECSFYMLGDPGF